LTKIRIILIILSEILVVSQDPLEMELRTLDRRGKQQLPPKKGVRLDAHANETTLN